MLDGQAERPPDRNPSCVAAEESGRRLARPVLESMDAIKLDAVVRETKPCNEAYLARNRKFESSSLQR
jgi:hypothetical protein